MPTDKLARMPLNAGIPGGPPERPARVLVVFGTRPEAIKMAPVISSLKARRDWFEPKVAVTAQHREMLDQVLAVFGIEPDYDLNIMEHGQTLAGITVRAISGLDRIMAGYKPDVVLVHGDTTTTFAGALVGFYNRIPVGHVEAGLRTGNKYSPFPEEMNRRLTGAAATLHFAPTAHARENLIREGVDPASIVVTGNTVIDALLWTVKRDYEFQDPVLRKAGFNDRAGEGGANRKRMILVTTHRRENMGEPMRRIYEAFRRILELHPDCEMVFPVHKNPAVRKIVYEELGKNPRIHLIEPPDYLEFVHLMNRSDLILTDSGGLQEEAPALHKPVLVLRDTTERPEGIEAGTLKLVGTGTNRIVEEADRILRDPGEYWKMANAPNPYGDGKASERIAGALGFYFGYRDEPPEEFGGLLQPVEKPCEFRGCN